jgi:hypothetical protein
MQDLSTPPIGIETSNLAKPNTICIVDDFRPEREATIVTIIRVCLGFGFNPNIVATDDHAIALQAIEWLKANPTVLGGILGFVFDLNGRSLVKKVFESGTFYYPTDDISDAGFKLAQKVNSIELKEEGATLPPVLIVTSNMANRVALQKDKLVETLPAIIEQSSFQEFKNNNKL